MSVPLPSPSALQSPTSAKAIPRGRPTPTSLGAGNESHSPASPGQSPAQGGQLRGSGSRERRGSRSGTRPGSAALGQSPGDGVNWRERTMGGGQGQKSKGPERTVGGFGKKEVPSPTAASGGGASAIPGSAAAATESAAKKALSAEKTAALAHVPCRFYKSGTCTAGDSCPFSHEGGGKKEVCQWFLKGNCKFGHKCALAHLRPGEPISMDRKNKRAAQMDAKADPKLESKDEKPAPGPAPEETPAAPVPIRSAASTHQTPPTTMQSRGTGSSPMREPYGPPSAMGAGSPSGGFMGRSPGAFGASPNRPSPLSASFSARLTVPGSFALKGSPTTAVQPLRQPATAGPTSGFSASLSHSPLTSEYAKPPLSASLADSSYLRRSIWAHSEKADEVLSPRRPIAPASVSRAQADVFDNDDDDDHGEDLIPSSLSDLLTPMERARRKSRRDSNDYFGASPARSGSQVSPNPRWLGERLAQSANATMGPPNFLQGLWSPTGSDARQGSTGSGSTAGGDFTFGPATAAPTPKHSLLSQQRSPVSSLRASSCSSSSTNSRPAVSARGMAGGADVDLTTHLVPPQFPRVANPSSPSARALSEHAPGMSLPGGVAAGMSRLHLQDEAEMTRSSHRGGSGHRREEEKREEVDKGEDREEVMFAMDG